MSKGIDYTKWDKLQISDSDHEDDHEEGDEEVNELLRQRMQQDQATSAMNGGVSKTSPFQTSKLPEGAKVSIGPSGPTIVTEPRSQPAAVPPPLSGPKKESAAPTAAKKTSGAVDPDEEQADEDDFFLMMLCRNGNTQEIDTLKVPGPGEPIPVLWGQTKLSARAAYLLPSTAIKGKDVQKCTMTSDYVKFEISHPSVGSSPLKIETNFPTPIKDDEKYIEGCWELKTLPSRQWRLLIVSLEKSPVGQGIYVWWDRYGQDSTVLDTTKFPDRVSEVNPKSLEKAEAFRKVWDEAHQEFVAKRKKVNEKKAARQAEIEEED